MTTENEVNSVISIFKEMKTGGNHFSCEGRKNRLQKLKTWIDRNREIIVDSLYADLRKSREEILLTEIYVVTSEIKHAINNLSKWMRPQEVGPMIVTLTARASYSYQPKGVVLIIAPWNFPFSLTLSTLVSALAAGNRVIIKPSSISHHTSLLIKKLVEEIFDPHEVFVCNYSRESAAPLLQQPFDHIFFIGSSRTAKQIMATAAQNLSSVTLELGGKNPLLITASADISDAVKKVVWAKFMNSGQSCIAPDFALVHSSVYERFLAELKAEIKRVYGKSAAERKSCIEYGRIISETHFERIEKLLLLSIAEGCNVDLGGNFDKESLYFEPTIITNVLPYSPIMEEEIFGPILPVFSYNALNQALEMVKENQQSLTLYLFSADSDEIRQIRQQTTSGAFCINDLIPHFLQLNLPFGGVGRSGIGKSHGFFGFRAFSNERAEFQYHRFNPLKLIFPPYNVVKRVLIKLILRYL